MKNSSSIPIPMLRFRTLLPIFCFAFLLILWLPFEAHTQNNGDYEPSEARSDFSERKKSIMTGNLLRATYHNFGHAGRTDSDNLDEILFEYPRNTGRVYMYFMSVMMGAKVRDQTDQTKPYRTFPIVDVANYRTSRTGESWVLNPIEGYTNPNSNEIARSDDPSTWPSVWPDKLRGGGTGWPGAWNGFFGKNQFNADVEFYYRAGDDLYTRYLNQNRHQFRPDSTDPTRGGLGLILDTRVMAWSQTLINSVHFNIFEIINDSSYDYDKVAFGLWIADFVARTGSDDQPVFDDLRSIAYLTDLTRSPAPEAFDGGKIGEMGLKFLETPGNARDGIDNDGDAGQYDPFSEFYEADNKNVFDELYEENGGFYTEATVRDSVIPLFDQADFEARTLTPGDTIVAINGNNGERIIKTYPQGGGTIVTQGRTIELPADGLTVIEDILPTSDPNFGVHTDLLDNDLDGIVDENRPNHLNKRTFINQQEVVRAVRHINYLYFDPGDTLQRGLIVPNHEIRQRMQNDADFRELVNEYHNGRYRNVHTSAPMIDEARNDHFDNDQDWEASKDDVGIQGDPDTPSEGQGDGKPTSGAGTPYPGEPNIDKTDIDETDMLGVTNASIFGAGTIDLMQDTYNFNQYLSPGTFDRRGEQGIDSDLLISSGLFPLDRGEAQRFSVAANAVQTNGTRADDRQANNDDIEQAIKAYEANYQFATAPTCPKLRAVSGDGKVTLYWDDEAENSFDRFLSRVAGIAHDFEGYRVYRATDAAFQDAKTITDAFGQAQFHAPLKIFDKKDGRKGLHPVPINGVHYNMGDDSGIQHKFVDSTVTNGKRYFYAVTSFDFGYVPGDIAPSECAIKISRNPDGSFTFGSNVLSVRPSSNQAGYISPEDPSTELVEGSPGGKVRVEIVDPGEIRPDHLYSVVFEDTLVPRQNEPDQIQTQNFSLLDLTKGHTDTLIKKSKAFDGQSIPVIHGFQLTLDNVNELRINNDLSRWKYDHETPPHNYDFAVFNAEKAADYELVIGDNVGFGQSITKTITLSSGNQITLDSMQTNFRVYNQSTGNQVKYAFADIHTGDGTQEGQFSATAGLTGLTTDVIVFVEEFQNRGDTTTYRIQLSPKMEGSTVVSTNPQPGDTLELFTTKPFTSNSEFRFRTAGESAPRIKNAKLRAQLDSIKVVPNPYVVSNPYEPAVTQTNPTQRRELHFTHMPVPSTLRIFTVAGKLIEEIQIDKNNPNLVGGEFGGTYVWDMLTKDNLELSYGVYIYHITVPDVGETTGKFAVIK